VHLGRRLIPHRGLILKNVIDVESRHGSKVWFEGERDTGWHGAFETYRARMDPMPVHTDRRRPLEANVTQASLTTRACDGGNTFSSEASNGEWPVGKRSRAAPMASMMWPTESMHRNEWGSWSRPEQARSN